MELFYTQGNQDEFRFYRCQNCKLVNYDLSAGQDQEKYEQAYADVDPFDENVFSNIAQTTTHRFIARHFPVPGRMLEIGCGNGRLLHLSRQDGWIVSGLELSPALAELTAKRLGISVEVADFLEYKPRQADKYDLVVLRHVLEHIPDCKAAMIKIRAMLADDGRALLEFPNIDGFDIKWKRRLRGWVIYRKRYPASYKPGHCNEFCRESFRNLLDRTDFALAAWETYSYEPVLNFIFNRCHIGNKARALISIAGAPALRNAQNALSHTRR